VSRSYRTTSLSVDSDVVARLMSLAQEIGLYDSRRDAREDSWEELFTVLMDRFEGDTYE
jgi:hypothetical protein